MSQPNSVVNPNGSCFVIARDTVDIYAENGSINIRAPLGDINIAGGSLDLLGITSDGTTLTIFIDDLVMQNGVNSVFYNGSLLISDTQLSAFGSDLDLQNSTFSLFTDDFVVNNALGVVQVFAGDIIIDRDANIVNLYAGNLILNQNTLLTLGVPLIFSGLNQSELQDYEENDTTWSIVGGFAASPAVYDFEVTRVGRTVTLNFQQISENITVPSTFSTQNPLSTRYRPGRTLWLTCNCLSLGTDQLCMVQVTSGGMVTFHPSTTTGVFGIGIGTVYASSFSWNN